LDICVGVFEFLVTPLLMGPAAYLARAGLKSQSESAPDCIINRTFGGLSFAYP